MERERQVVRQVNPGGGGPGPDGGLDDVRSEVGGLLDAAEGTNWVHAQLKASAETTASTVRSVTASGEIDTARYGSVLYARQLVGVRGVGYSFDGLYYVKSVSHSIRRGEYKQSFQLSREGLGATVPAETVGADEFDRVAGPLCVSLERARNGVEPRFVTPEAYLVVVDERRQAITAFIGDLLALAGPDDAPGLPGDVAQALREPRDLLDAVEEAARADRLDDAARGWARVDPGIDAALSLLRDHGAAPC